jgi:hypothetical protein
MTTPGSASSFVLSPIDEWPPRRYPDWVRLVDEAANAWTAWSEDESGAFPNLVRQGAAQDAGRAAGFENAAAGITGVFFAVALSAVKSAVGSPEFRRIGTV